MVSASAPLVLSRRGLSVCSSVRPAFHKELLIYSSRRDDVVDTSIKRSSAKLAKQELVRMNMRNEKLRSRLDIADKPNVSAALQFLYGKAAFTQHDAKKVSPEILEAEIEGADASQEPAVYPFSLYPESLAKHSARLEEGEIKSSEEKTRNSDEDDANKRLGRRRRRRRRGYNNNPEEAEQDFDPIDGELTKQEAKKMLSADEMFRYGSADPMIASSDVPCGGCGAILHCKDPKMPGFTPVEMFRGKSRRKLRETLCQRCYVIKNYNVALKVSVAPEEYPSAIQHLHTKRALVLVVVDLLDFPGSVWPGLLDLLGTQKRIILVGNKVDLLPQDSVDYLKRVEKAMKAVFLQKCNDGLISYEPDIIDSCLISARTGFNVEALIDIIYKSWKTGRYYNGADIYLVGTTNVGKSSVFNALLESDMCKVNAVDCVEKAMTSPVPGTTLNLLKFPIMRPDPHRINERFQRLKVTRHVYKIEEEERIEMLRKHKDRKYAVVRGPVEMTFATHYADKAMPLTGGFFSLERRDPTTKLPARLDPTDPQFADGKWCYDTPGAVCYDQIIDLLTQQEVAKMLPDLPIRPRSFAMRTGQSIFLGGLARMDLLPGPYFGVHPVVATVFCSDDLPINMVRTEDAEEFYREGLKSGFLEVPSGEEERLKDFPDLECKDLEVDGIDLKTASCEVVLSSAGWVTLTPNMGQMCRLRAWTPEGRGIFVRDPPFLPFATQLKGRRIGGTPAYVAKKIFIPEIKKR